LIASRTGIPVQTLLIEFSSPYMGKTRRYLPARIAAALPHPAGSPL
jgi:hypothetical protein